MQLLLTRSLMIATCVLVVACGGDKEAEVAEQPAESMADAATQMSQAAEQMGKAAQQMAAGQASDVPLIPAQTLQERFPKSIDGMERYESEREESGVMGMKVSVASARYRDDTRSLEITMTDAGGTGMLAAMGAAWAMVDVDRTREDGYERTVTIDGNRGFESERRYDGGVDSELQVMVGGRLLVKLDGSGVSMDATKRALKDLNVKSLVP